MLLSRKHLNDILRFLIWFTQTTKFTSWSEDDLLSLGAFVLRKKGKNRFVWIGAVKYVKDLKTGR